jgi:heme/copper-type cytochrome/quinol oxidase subunit 2
MTPLGIFAAGYELISSWLMSMLVMLAVFVSVVVCLVLVEFIFERGALVRAYTVKSHLTDSEGSSSASRNAM